MRPALGRALHTFFSRQFLQPHCETWIEIAPLFLYPRNKVGYGEEDLRKTFERFFLVELTNSIYVCYNCFAMAIMPCGGALCPCAPSTNNIKGKNQIGVGSNECGKW